MSSPEKQMSPRGLRALLRVRVWLAEIVRPNELQVTLFWAGVIGFAGACASVAFRRLTSLVHLALTQQGGGLVESFIHLSPVQRLLVPAVGGLIAGVIIYYGMRWGRRRSSTDYMEAIVLGDGIISSRSSLVKCVSAMFSIASGASIGREGPLVQLSAMIASRIGRWRKTPTLQLRLLVACGAAAGIASAYNAPIGGALFVAEIILQSLAMESFGPLVFSSVVSTLTVRQLLGEQPLYEIASVRLGSNWEILPLLLLGLLAGLAAPWFLRLLRASERLFTKLALPVYLRLGLGGLIVGALAIWQPEVCGNGYSVVNHILHGELLWQALLFILVFKLIATAATFGSGAVGGVFTPTLFVGACVGQLVAHAVQSIWPGAPLNPQAFTVVGMGAFLAATTHAPIMAIIMLFELTLDYQLILPLMLACVVAHYACLAFEEKSIYAESLKRKGGEIYRQQLAGLSVADIMKPDPVNVDEDADFRAIAHEFITHNFRYLYVTAADGGFRGVIALHDVKSNLMQSELAELVVARDILHDDFPTIAPDASLIEALERFAHHDGERLPVTVGQNGKLIGSISKSDLLLALAERTKEPRPSAPASPPPAKPAA
ncbi:MAG: ClcB-like voltage-gated chloride channel protein [Chthoniobacter sp.]|uniref:ClcB-like voltage-gated chloride channel protein n=1 Tax=Chthoniobacter sp. TaxID=2510640 RepID=UPI0032A9E176